VVSPVTFPAGRCKLGTNPSDTGVARYRKNYRYRFGQLSEQLDRRTGGGQQYIWLSCDQLAGQSWHRFGNAVGATRVDDVIARF
jgi:hypothetical protein